MAFKPFDYFRKHQKPVFAVMAIICMLVFVLQYSQGDALQQIMSLFGGDRNRGEVVIHFYKSDVHRGDLVSLADQRQMANDFLMMHIGNAAGQARMDYEKELTPTGDGKNLVINQDIAAILEHERTFERQRMQGIPLTREQNQTQLAQTLADIEVLEGILQRGKLNDFNRTRLQEPDANILRNLLLSMRVSAWLLDARLRGFGRNDLAFGGSSSTEDLLDFKMWLHQADQLGIELVEEDLRKIINYDAGRDVLSKNIVDDDKVKDFLKSRKKDMYDYKPSDLVRAVTNEYRAALAQEVILGRSDGLRGFLAPITGYEIPVGSVSLQEFAAKFRALQTKVTVALLPLPTKKFVTDGQPSPQELAELFSRYRKTEAKPDSQAPGLKIPRKVKADYLAIPTELPVFKPSIELHLLAETQLVRRLLAIGSAGAAGGGVLPAVGADLVPLFDGKDPLISGYKEYVARQLALPWVTSEASAPAAQATAWWLPAPPAPRFHFAALHEKSLIEGVTTNPGAIAALIALPALRNLSTPWMIENYCLDAGTRREQVDRDVQARGVLRVIAQAELAAASPSGNPALSFLFVAAYQPTDPSSYRMMAPTLWSEALANGAHYSKDALAEELAAFIGQLGQYRASPREADLFLQRVNEGKPVKLDVPLKAATELKAGDPLLKEDPTLHVKDKVYTFHLKGLIHFMKDYADRVKIEDKDATPELAGLIKAFEDPNRRTQPPMFQGQPVPPRTTLADELVDTNIGAYQVQSWSPEAGDAPTIPNFGGDPARMEDLRQRFIAMHLERVVSQSKEAYLFWVADAKPEKEPTSLEEVRPEAVQAWRTLQARKKALQAANAIKTNLSTPSGPDLPDVEKALRAAVAKAGFAGILGEQKAIYLPDVSEVVENPGTREDARITYRPYGSQPIAIKYPRKNLGNQLVSLRNFGDSVVVSDQPEDFYYLAVLMSRKEVDPGMLDEALKKTGGFRARFDTFWPKEVLGPRREAYRKDLMRQLRVEAVGADKVDDNGNYILPDSVKRGRSNAE